jgi:hypothetical protein
MVRCSCIPQDDAVARGHKIDLMASIYFNAFVTIMAASKGDPARGITGLRGMLHPRNLDQQVHPFLGDKEGLERNPHIIPHAQTARTRLVVARSAEYTVEEADHGLGREGSTRNAPVSISKKIGYRATFVRQTQLQESHLRCSRYCKHILIPWNASSPSRDTQPQFGQRGRQPNYRPYPQP